MNYLLVYFKGMLMGIADLVPGISGGTVALITGIYQRLINAIASINSQNIKLFFKGQFAQFWKHVDGWFLTAVFTGILTSIFVFAALIKYLLTSFPVQTWSFFFGLIMASAWVLIKHVKGIHLLQAVALILGIIMAYGLSAYSGFALSSGLWAIFIAGLIAVSAMILPGLSGTLILILLGKYQAMLTAVENRDFITLGVFLIGVVIGLMLFSRLLKWLLSRYYQTSMLFLSGLMLGSLVKVWPWKMAGVNVFPLSHPEPQLFLAVILMIAAASIILVFARLDK